MNRKTKQGIAVSGCVVALSLLALLSAPSIEREPAPAPPVAPVPKGQTLSACTAEDRVIPPPEPRPATVGEKTATVEPHNTHATEIDSEPPEHGSGAGIVAQPRSPRDKPTPAPVTPKIPQSPASAEPKMSDTRTVDGQKQVYFLGFGWIDDNDTPNEAYNAEDMYENGNKVGSMGGGTLVDGDGDINKMVGIMD